VAVLHLALVEFAALVLRRRDDQYEVGLVDLLGHPGGPVVTGVDEVDIHSDLEAEAEQKRAQLADGALVGVIIVRVRNEDPWRGHAHHRAKETQYPYIVGTAFSRAGHAGSGCGKGRRGPARNGRGGA
jgi:hypothetical protein